jgi:hypothetical protein
MGRAVLMGAAFAMALICQIGAVSKYGHIRNPAEALGRDKAPHRTGTASRQQPRGNRACGRRKKMFDVKTVSLEWGGKTLTLETGRIARQANGAVLATYGETVVLCAVTAAKSVKEGQDFFPLTVHYQEKFSAAGRIPGGFFKRERGATENAGFPPDRPSGPPAVPRRFLQRDQRYRSGAEL